MKARAVYLLHHMRELSKGEEDAKLVGVYSSRKGAEEARARSSKLPGFRRHLEGFTINRQIVNQDDWTSGFITVKQTK